MPGIEPIKIGPTWQKNPDGSWYLPKRTLGWHVLAWGKNNLRNPRTGGPWIYTPEQARLTLWWYAIDEEGNFLYVDGVIQRLKGWGKDPLIAAWCATELVGPCRFGGWADEEKTKPIAVPNPSAWVVIAAVAKDQTRNTMTLFPSLFTPAAKERYALDIGKEVIYANGGAQRIEAVTSSPDVIEGARATFTVMNETQNWRANNGGHDMAGAIDGNAAKAPEGSARVIQICNAYRPNEDSVAQRTREAYEDAAAGKVHDAGIFYDSLEAPPDAPLDPETAVEVIKTVRGDSVWLDPERIVKSILNPRNPASESRRKWYNQIVAAEDAWVVPADWDLCADPEKTVGPDEPIALFFDGSKSDDATALVGCRISDGHIITLGLWQRPPGERGKSWIVPRAEVDHRVSEIFRTYKVVAFWGDPSHTHDDESGERFWDSLFDDWHQRYCRDLELWAVPGKGGHAVMWDMTSPARTAAFTAAAERMVSDIESSARMAANGQPDARVLTHDGDPRMRAHVRNARRYPNKYGVSLWKGHRESARKIDLAICAVGARMVRREYLNAKSKLRQRTGRVI